VSDPIAARAGEHLRRYRRSHQGIDLVDYVIAATAELHEATLATLNVRHFPMFEGLGSPW
jgi:predicted nucleic acid-binding protein